MKKNPAVKSQQALGTLVRQLASVETRLQAAAGSGIDAVVDAQGNYHLLQLAQESLRQNELKFRALIEHNADVIALLAADGTIVYDSPAVVRVLGYQQSELAGTNVFSLCHPEEVEVAQRILARLIRRPGRSLNLTLRCRHRDGSYRWLEGSATNLLQEPAVRAIVLNYRDITERREMEQKLRRSEANLAIAQHIAHIGSWELELADLADIDRNPLRWSAELFRIFGYEPDAVEVNNELFFRHVHPDDRAKIRAAMAETLRTGQTYNLTHRIILQDGAERVIHELADVIRDRQGRMLRVIGTAQDITERRAAEQRLEEHSTFIADVLNSLTSHVAVLDERGDIIAVNESWRRFGRENGVPADRRDFLGSNYLEACAAAVRLGDDTLAREVREALPALLAGRRESFQLEYPCHSPQGPRWFKLRASRLTGPRKGAVVAHQDISERKLAELALQESEARFRQLAESIGQVFWLRDPENTRIFYVSPAYERIWGRPNADLLANAKDWLDGIHPEDRERVRANAANAANGGSHDQVFRIIRRDGTERWVHDRGFPVRDERGNIVRIAGLADDITEQRKLESQFLRAQRMESIGTLAGGIAHDLNNVLTPILMSIQLLQQADCDGQQRRLLETLETSARRGAGMVKQVLMFARGVDGDRVRLHPRLLLQESERIIGETFPRAITIETEVADDCKPVLGDITQLQQVLINLCVNARDAMPDGGTLRIDVRNELIDQHYTGFHPGARPGDYVVLQVSDTGSGIPREIIDRIFDPFFTTKQQGHGTGLGLSTVQAIVKSHEGFMHVYSEPGRGSVFKVFLPAVTPTQEETAPQMTLELPRGRGELILVVDDEQPIRDVTRRTLEAFGYRVIVAQDGAEAVALFALHQADVAAVLTDMMMPVMDGPSAILAINRIRPGTPIIAASGLNSMRDLAAKVPANVGERLQKPYTADKLLQAMHRALQKRD